MFDSHFDPFFVVKILELRGPSLPSGLACCDQLWRQQVGKGTGTGTLAPFPSKWAKGYSAQVKTEGLGTPISGIFQQLHGDCYFRFVHFVHFASVFVTAGSPQGAEVLLSASYAWPWCGSRQQPASAIFVSALQQGDRVMTMPVAKTQ